jgi:hypothetical protein
LTLDEEVESNNNTPESVLPTRKPELNQYIEWEMRVILGEANYGLSH